MTAKPPKPSKPSRVFTAPMPPGGPALQERCGVHMIGEDAEVWVSATTKLSKEFQSAGVEVGLRFKTGADHIDDAIAAAVTKVRAAALSETQRLIGEVLESL